MECTCRHAAITDNRQPPSPSAATPLAGSQGFICTYSLFPSTSCSRTWLDLLRSLSLSFITLPQVGLRAVRDGINPANQVTSSLFEEKEVYRRITNDTARMFASLKRSSDPTHGSGSIGTEKDSGADYADLEKRADGRWSVQNPVDGVQVDGRTRRQKTCCGLLPAHVGVLFLIMFALMVGVVFMGVTGMNLAQNGVSFVREHGRLTGVPQAGRCGMSTSSLLLPLYRFGHSSSSPVCLGTPTFVAVFAHSLLNSDTIYRLYATWRDRLKLFTTFWFAFLCHWVLDLASTVVFLVVAYQRDVTHPSDEVCLEHGLEPGCVVPINVMFVIVTTGLCLFKIIAACKYLRFSTFPRMHLTILLDALYIMHKYRLALLSRSQQPFSPTQTKSGQKSLSPSAPVHRPSLSPFKPKYKTFPKSPRQGRPWPPTNIPTIKIDLASDQSSASSYSNGSSGPGSAGFAVFEFATKYPSLRTMPLDPIGENLKAALEREREREEADLGLVNERNANGRGKMVGVPTLPKISVAEPDQKY